MAQIRGVMIPPGGFQGNAEQTIANQALLGRPRRPTRKRRTRKKTTRAKTRKKRTTRRAAPRGRLKKGSPAAKRRMKQLRAMQKRGRRRR